MVVVSAPAKVVVLAIEAAVAAVPVVAAADAEAA